MYKKYEWIQCTWVIAYVHHITVTAAALKRNQADQRLSQHRLIHDLCTRWMKCLSSSWNRDGLCQQPSPKGTPPNRQMPMPEFLNWLTITSTLADILPALHGLKQQLYVTSPMSTVQPVNTSVLSRHLKPQDGTSISWSQPFQFLSKRDKLHFITASQNSQAPRRTLMSCPTQRNITWHPSRITSNTAFDTLFIGHSSKNVEVQDQWDITV